MKKVLWILAVVLTLFSCQTKGDEVEEVTLTDEEKEDVLTLREEEKLARDVYLYAYEQYGLQIFNNIASSEQEHMDMVLGLINKYGLDDPASPDRGVFNNPVLQDLYNQLTAQVDLSELDALIVGATIEDLDIHDIKTFESHTNKTDLLEVYAMLQCGSRNHLRAYYGQLDSRGYTYTAQYISQQELEEIVNSPNERCGSH